MADRIAPEVNIVKLRDGRNLGFAVYGDSDGVPVLCLHGVPGTRLMFRPADRTARGHGLRLIAVDRPGFGQSTPKPGRRLRDWVPDVEALAVHLGLDRFGLLAISGGSPFAVQTAVSLPDQVSALALVSPMGPIRDLASTVETLFSDRLFFLRYAGSKRLLGVSSRAGNALFRRAPSLVYDGFVRTLPPADRAILSRPEWKAQVIEDVFESIAQEDGAGFRDDLRIFSHSWGLDFEAVRAPTVLWQGLADTIVPVQIAIRLGELIPNARVHLIEGAGHFWVYDNFGTVLGALADLIGNRKV